MSLVWRLPYGERFATTIIVLLLGLILSILSLVVAPSAEVPVEAGPLVVASDSNLAAVLPSDSHLLIQPAAIEGFLSVLDDSIPDWAAVYGHEHHDAGHDERLFELNRSRDERRRDKTALEWRVTFLWAGQLSPYDPARAGFPVAIGPDFMKTRWGWVRFKAEELPSNLTALAAPSLRDRLVDRMKDGKPIDIKVAMTGHLIPEESVIYDFSHEQEGQGLIMPVVRIERMDYLLVEVQ
jgi:hypothetical protein